MRRYVDIPPVWVILHLLLAWLLARWLPLFVFKSMLTDLLAAFLAVSGVVLATAAVLTLAREGTPIEPRHVPRRIVTRGPYAFTRNPIYLGMVLVLAAWGLWLGALSALMTVPLFMAIITRRFIREEEELLHRHFGEEARAWMERTRRWL